MSVDSINDFNHRAPQALKWLMSDGTIVVDVFPFGEIGGSSVTMNHTDPDVNDTSTSLISANPNRKYLLIVNDSDTDFYINIGNAAVMNKGILVKANGSSYEISNKNGNLSTAEVNAICSGTGKNCLVTEGV